MVVGCLEKRRHGQALEPEEDPDQRPRRPKRVRTRVQVQDVVREQYPHPWPGLCQRSRESRLQKRVSRSRDAEGTGTTAANGAVLSRKPDT